MKGGEKIFIVSLLLTALPVIVGIALVQQNYQQQASYTTPRTCGGPYHKKCQLGYFCSYNTDNPPPNARGVCIRIPTATPTPICLGSKCPTPTPTPITPTIYCLGNCPTPTPICLGSGCPTPTPQK